MTSTFRIFLAGLTASAATVVGAQQSDPVDIVDRMAAERGDLSQVLVL